MKPTKTHMETDRYKSAPVGRRSARSMDGVLPRPRQYIGQSARMATEARRRTARPQQYRPATAVPTKPVKRRRFNGNMVLTFACLLLFVGFMVYGRISPNGNHESSRVKAETASAPGAGGSNASKSTRYNGLTAAMNTAIAAQSGLSASATLIDLSSGQTYAAGDVSDTYTAASTAKLVTVFDYIHQVELGRASLSQTIDGDTAQDIIQRMIVYSDNDAWASLNNYLTLQQQQTYVSSLGLSATIQPENWQFTSGDMAKLLRLLQDGKLMDGSHQRLVYGYMSHTTVTNLIQAAVPASATVYHKYGQVLGVLNDASIIKYQGHAYVLVIYTNNPSGTTSLYSQQVNLIHAVTSAAFSRISP